MNTKKLKGFTLVELLVVVSIIASLSAIGIPMYNKYKIKSSQDMAISQAKIALKELAVVASSNYTLPVTGGAYNNAVTKYFNCGTVVAPAPAFTCPSGSTPTMFCNASSGMTLYKGAISNYCKIALTIAVCPVDTDLVLPYGAWAATYDSNNNYINPQPGVWDNCLNLVLANAAALTASPYDVNNQLLQIMKGLKQQ